MVNIMEIGVIVQARTSSSRLPEKVLMDLPYGSRVSVLEQVIRRLKQSTILNKIIIATTYDDEDEKIVDVAKKEKVNYFKGSKYNVLKRYYLAAKENNLDIIVRITSDCPCIDYTIMDDIIKTHMNTNSDYTSNKIKESFPRGLDVEVFNFDVLENAFENADNDFEREHVTPFIYKSHPELFKITSFEINENFSDIRVTLDTKEDYALLSCVYDNLYEENNFFLLEDILRLFNEKPWLNMINQNIIQKKVCLNLSEELRETIQLCDIQDLNNAKKLIEKTFSKYLK